MALCMLPPAPLPLLLHNIDGRQQAQVWMNKISQACESWIGEPVEVMKLGGKEVNKDITKENEERCKVLFFVLPYINVII